ncbi:GNAT family N-acetyltransferase [Vibrio vulnificus]|uniref:GCN5-related N-acetyltransferase n=2 Tax=Vibrio vulnificus TaxID=672 RepID=A0AAN1PN86_VIBVL|nr:GNAT family N-acetyltransferase [Vibrio vulnificus]AXX59762.1 GCN5-related N-acetyltransferase [Vibrio vulnificus]MDS1846354.1 GNAT family N-acetyltransferase [Vibrio vulnificus]
MKFRVRKALIGDIDGIAHIHVSSWAYAYNGLMPKSFIESYTFEKRQKLWSNIIERDLAVVLVAEGDEGLSGFLCFGQPKTLKGTDAYDLSSIYIDPDKIGVGIGQLLYDKCESMLRTLNAQKVSLWALDSNERALSFYTKQGFTPTGESNKEQADDVVLNDIELAKVLSA